MTALVLAVILGLVPRIHAKTQTVVDCWLFGMDPRHKGEGDARWRVLDGAPSRDLRCHPGLEPGSLTVALLEDPGSALPSGMTSIIWRHIPHLSAW